MLKKNALAESLKRLRKDKDITQDGMAEYLRIKRQTYSAYERGVSTPDVFVLAELASFFNVSADYLLGREEKASAEQKETRSTEERVFRLIEDNPRSLEILERMDGADNATWDKLSAILDLLFGSQNKD